MVRRRRNVLTRLGMPILGAWVAMASGLGEDPARAQSSIPGLPAAASPTPAKGGEADKGEKGEKAGAKEKVVTVSGPIKVDNAVDDHAIEATLETLLPKFPGVRRVEATVNQGVVLLDGLVDDDDTRNEMTGVARQVEGVRMVVNRLATDAEVLTAPQLVLGKLGDIGDYLTRHWLLILLALAILLTFSGAARVFNGYSETLLAPFIGNTMLRSVFGSLVSSALVLGGLMFGLSILNLTHAVLSVLGLAGVVGLAVGFAFKDIAENFIASVLLGVRRPFQIGDYVTIAGQSGVVRSLNTRATVLVTLEGNHVRIPNNIVYKEILINATASVSYRSNFDVVIPYDASTAAATEAMTQALRDLDGVLPDPPARALVEALEPGGVRLRSYYWVPVQGVDWFKLNSDAKLRVKVALQTAGIFAPPALAAAPSALPSPAPNGSKTEAGLKVAASSVAQAEANLRHDTRAARDATAVPAEGQRTPMQHVLNEAESCVSDEGANLLAVGAR